MQQEFVRRYTAYLKSIRKDAGKSEAEVKETPEYQQLADEASASLDKVKADISDKDKQVAAIQAKLDAVTDPFQNQRGRIVVITFKLEICSQGQHVGELLQEPAGIQEEGTGHPRNTRRQWQAGAPEDELCAARADL